jgi:hypothetical protein
LAAVGLVLEIIGSVFMLSEARTFRNYLAMDQWIAKTFSKPDYAADNGLFLDLADQIAAGRGAYGATDRIKWTTQCQLDVSNSSTQIADLASSSLMKAAPMFLYTCMISKPPA